jgi:predicted N-acetyltransferase YhbS
MSESNGVAYALEPDLPAAEMIDVLRRSTLGERRPIDDADRIGRMIRGATLVVTARVAGRLVGVSRALTDHAYCCYLSDLAVDQVWQRRGIGRELVRRTQEAAGPEAMLVLIAAPQASDYYGRIGMQRHESCWVLPRRR